jgi:hypothetical protein
LPAVKRYPLEALENLRKQQRDEQSSELAKKVEQTVAEQQRLAQLLREREQASDAAQKERDAERSRAQQAAACAADFQRLGAYEQKVQRDLKLLELKESQQRQRLGQAQTAEGTARRDLSQADARVHVVEQHHARFSDREHNLEESQREEEALEVYNGRSLSRERTPR